MKAIVIALSLFASAAQAELTPYKTYRSGELPAKPFAGAADHTLKPLPAAIVFELSGPPQIVNKRLVVLRGKLRNPLDRAQMLVTFGGNEINALMLQPLGDPQFAWSKQVPLFPPAPAIAVTRLLPPHSLVEYEAMFDLSRLEWQGTPTIRFEWRFGFHRQRDAQTGIVSVTLPEREQSNAPPR